MGITKVKTTEVTFTSPRSLSIVPFDRRYMISYWSSIVIMSLSCIISKTLLIISQNLKMSHSRDIFKFWDFEGLFVNPEANTSHANQCTKFEVSRLSHSRDILGEGLTI